MCETYSKNVSTHIKMASGMQKLLLLESFETISFACVELLKLN